MRAFARPRPALCDAKGLWHKHGVTRQRSSRPPLDRTRLEELALRYVGRFATSRKRLAAYLFRKLRECGWCGPGKPPVDDIVQRLADLGYVDDASFALARARSMGARGYGRRRLAGALVAAGIEDADAEPAMRHCEEESGQAILSFARRRRIGPFASGAVDRPTREKWVAAMVRAGHDFGLARRIADCAPGDLPSPDDLPGR